ncbi:hypothetical protein ONZ45_g9806 [Pleurotus djamor]|nr:hypothetical protein ONZ45_g9806 [Pleurotus djamor]
MFPGCQGKVNPPDTLVGDEPKWPDDDNNDDNSSDQGNDDVPHGGDGANDDAPPPDGNNDQDDQPSPPGSPPPSERDEVEDDDPPSPPRSPRESPAPEPNPFAPRRQDQQERRELLENLRRSGRTRKIPGKPGNVFGEKRSPLDIVKDTARSRYWREQIGDKEPGSSRLRNRVKPRPRDIPEPTDNQESGSTPNADLEPETQLDNDEMEVDRMIREGGVELINFLLSKAVHSSNAIDNICEWTYRDILKLPPSERKLWFDAMKEELDALRQRKVYSLEKLPAGKKAIKFVRYETVRMILALAALNGLHLEALDVKTAFLYGKLDEEIYMEQPEGFRIPGKEDFVLRLWRAIYGLKQASLAWWRELTKSMEELGFKRAFSDSGCWIFIHPDGNYVIALVYVDDALFAGSNRELTLKLKREFMKRWECRDLGEAKEFLGIKIHKNGKKILIDQEAYLQKVIKRFNLTNCRHAKTPLPMGYKPEPYDRQSTPELRSKFQQVIGSLLYIMLGTRPDIAYAVIKMAQHSANPSKEHLEKAMHILRYLSSTPNYSIVYDGGKGEGLFAYTDSDWSSPKSTTGFFVSLASGITCWQSRKQSTSAHSSTEAEYMALSDTSRQIMWIKNLFGEMGFKLGPIPIFGDNQGSIFIASNPVSERKTKHIDIRYHYIRDCVEKKEIEIFFVEGSENPADMFTKNLGFVKFEKFRDMLGLVIYDDSNAAKRAKRIS